MKTKEYRMNSKGLTLVASASASSANIIISNTSILIKIKRANSCALMRSVKKAIADGCKGKLHQVVAGPKKKRKMKEMRNKERKMK